MTVADRYTRVATVASASDPSKTYEVSTDGKTLTCPCTGWTRRTGPNGERTCRHVREVESRLQSVGGLETAIRLIRRGVDVQVDVAVGAVNAAPVRPEPWYENLDVGVRKLVEDFAGRTVRPVMLAAIDEALKRAMTGQRPHVGNVGRATPDWLGGGRAIILRD